VDQLKQYILHQVANHQLTIEEAKKLLKELNQKNTSNEETSDDIAIIGMAGRFPKAADIKEFWNNILSGVNCIDRPSILRRKGWEDVLKDHFQLENLSEELLSFGGYLDDVNAFDAEFFGISKKEAKFMDPWQRNMLETVYLALEDAGYGGQTAYGTNTGVFIGRDHAVESSYAKIAGNVHPLVLTGSYSSILASRISHTFNFQGPSIVVDTACSSALVAIHQACLALKNEQCNLAVAGGINLRENFIESPDQPMQGILTEEPMVRTFDKSAKGTLLSEGVGAILLKRYKEAVKDGDRVYAIVKGSAVNNDGGKMGIATPNANMQQKVIEQSWESAGINPESISYIEAHGTGTLLGDPIEVKAITEAFKKFTNRKQFCAISTVKTNVGHTVAASGIASLVKAVFAMKYKKIPYHINFKEVNPYIDFTDSAVYVSDRTANWVDSLEPRRCGVNSFGFSGTNCHIVLEEPMNNGNSSNGWAIEEPSFPYLFSISTKNEKTLRELVKSYKYFLEDVDWQSLDLQDMCYTTLCGRGHYESRVLLQVNSIEELYNKILLLHNCNDWEEIDDSNIHFGWHRIIKNYENVKQNGEITDKDLNALNDEASYILKLLLDGDNLNWKKLSEYYVKGASIDWKSLFHHKKIFKTELPLYPLERKRVWIDGSEKKMKSAKERRRERQEASIRRKAKLVSQEDQNEIISPVTDDEKIMISIWKEVLNVEKIGVHDNFFSLGGDSIKVIQVTSKAQDQGFNMSVQQLFENQTIYELVQAVGKEKKEQKPVLIKNFELISDEDVSKIPSNIEDAYPISALQTGMLFHSIWSTSSESFHDILSLHIKEKLDETSFKKAVNIMVSKHPVLRTTFDFINFSKPLQLVHFNAKAPIYIEKITGLTQEEQDAYLEKWRSKQKDEGFDWSKPPLLRVFIHYRSDDAFQLSLIFHHSILDGWSVSSLLTELFKYYSLLKVGVPISQDSHLEIGFRDYIAAESKMIQADDAPKYWKEKLDGLEAIDLLSKRMNDDRNEHRFLQEIRLTVNEQLVEQLKEVSRKISVPLKTIFLAAHIKALQLISGKNDVLSGIVVNGRLEQNGGDRVLGLFLNTLPFRFNSSYSTWEELLRSVFQNEQEVIPYRRYPLAEIQKTTDKPIVISSIFNYQNFHIYNEVNNYGELEVLSDEMFEVTDVPLYVRFIQGRFNKEVTLGLQYDSDIFTESEIDRIGKYYSNILCAIASDSMENSLKTNLLTEIEQEKIKHWNSTETTFPKNNLLNMIETHALSTPDKIALTYGESHLSFSKMYEEVNQKVKVLKKIGLKPGMHIGVYMNRSIESVVSLLSIWKAGCVYVPLDPVYPSERIEYMIKDANLSLILTQNETNDFLSEKDVLVWNVDNVPNFQNENLMQQEYNSYHDDLAYIIYTSGSTGVPKGVMGRHSGLLNRCEWMWEKYPFREDEVCCCKTSISFIDSLAEILSPLAQGIQLVIFPTEIVMDPSSLVQEMFTHKVSRIVVVPSLLTLLLDLYDDLSNLLPHLQLCITSGEELTSSIVRQWNKKMPGRKLINLYGSSEVSADVLYYEINTNEIENIVVPLGRPISNTKVYILNSKLEQVPIGVVGYIYIGGSGLAIGYHNHENWTEERFVTISNGDIQEQVYKTGDLGYFNSDGEVIFKGRRDNQIQLNGYRIEPQEIETVLRRYKTIKEAVVKENQDSTNNILLVAYITGNSTDNYPSNVELKEFLQKYLPNYMVPNVFCFVESLPKLPNGKIDRNLLPSNIEQYTDIPGRNQSLTAIEKTLMEIWTSSLGQPARSIYEDFFNAGGNSLKAMRFIFMVQREFQITFTMREFYRKPKIYDVGLYVEQSLQSREKITELDSSLVSLSGDEISEYYPLTTAQEKIWTYQQLNSDSSAYMLKMKIDIKGDLDIKGLEWSLNELLKKHSVLRTKVIFNGDVPLQKVLEFSHYKIYFLDVSNEIDIDENTIFQRIENEMYIKHRQEYMFHMQGIKYAQDKYQLFFMIEHLIFDFWSIGLLVSELADLYGKWLSFRAGNISFPETEIIEIPFRNYVQWEQRLKNSDVTTDKLRYWEKMLSNHIPNLRLPTDRPRLENVLYTAKRTGLLFPAQLTDRIYQFSQSQNTTAFVTLLSAFYALMYKYTAKTDIIVGIPVSNRIEEEFESLIGCCIDTLALRNKFEVNSNFEEIMRASKDTFINAYIYNRLPFDYIVQKISTNKGYTTNIFQYMFNYMSEQDWNVKMPGNLDVSTSMVPSQHAKFELSVEVLDASEGMILEVEYARELYDASTIEQIKQDYLYLIEKMLENKNKPLSEIKLRHESKSLNVPLEEEATFDF